MAMYAETRDLSSFNSELQDTVDAREYKRTLTRADMVRKPWNRVTLRDTSEELAGRGTYRPGEEPPRVASTQIANILGSPDTLYEPRASYVRGGHQGTPSWGWNGQYRGFNASIKHGAELQEALASVKDASLTRRFSSTETRNKWGVYKVQPWTRTVIADPKVTDRLLPAMGNNFEGYGLGGASHSMWKPDAPRHFFADKAQGEKPLRWQR